MGRGWNASLPIKSKAAREKSRAALPFLWGWVLETHVKSQLRGDGCQSFGFAVAT